MLSILLCAALSPPIASCPGPKAEPLVLGPAEARPSGDEAGPVERKLPQGDLLERVQSHEARNGEVPLHYVTLGEGEPVLLLHGFPDYWYTWRELMPALEDRFELAAMDLRGYNRSGQPEAVNDYAMRTLFGDVAAVAEHWGKKKLTLVGHDWGAAIAWQVAMNRPDLVERLIVISVPHPSGFQRELSTSTEQHEDSQYARDFQAEGSEERLSAAGLAGWVRDPEARSRYVQAFERSSLRGMMHYYRANYPRSPAPGSAPPAAAPALKFPRIGVPVLVVHGLQDTALHAGGHAGCWDWIDADTTLVMVPDAGHFVQQDRPEFLARTVRSWLLQRTGSEHP